MLFRSPSLLRSRQAANEAAAVANLRTINTAQVAYLSSKGKYGEMRELIDFGLLDSRFLATISGYDYTVRLEARDYVATATPASTNTGRYEYYSTPDAVVRYSADPNRAPTNQAGSPVY